MLIHRDLSFLPVFKNAVVTIGSFDGVHIGHQQIIEQLKTEAKKINGETVIITFNPHPRKILYHAQFSVPILTTLNEKIELLEQKGIDHLVVVAFNEIFSNQTAEQYVEDFLFEKFHPHTVIIGYDHKFGKDRKGDYHLLEDYGMKLGFFVKEIPESILNEVIISSTRIREALLKTDIKTANKFLGYNYFFEGTVVEGNKLGRTIGFPTANMEVQNQEKLIPGNGVYAVETEIRNQKSGVGNQDSEIPHSLSVIRFKGMMNIGMRPTIDGNKKTIEVNIFDFDKDIYGEKIRVYIKDYLRSEIKFSGLDALKEQLVKDKNEALKKLMSAG